MPTIFEQLEYAVGIFKDKLSVYDAVDEGHGYSWPNFIYTSPTFRRAHLDIVDARATKKLYMAHLCIFPHVNDPSPVYGLDIIAGPTKVTGAFHDFSPIGKDSKLLPWFKDHVDGLEWSKPRQLPDWAKRIFSGNMIAAGNISTEEELSTFFDLAFNSFDHYLGNIGEVSEHDYSLAQNNYCRNQKQNPHTPKVMSALGFSDEEVSNFIDRCLFPEVPIAHDRTFKRFIETVLSNYALTK